MPVGRLVPNGSRRRRRVSVMVSEATRGVGYGGHSLLAILFRGPCWVCAMGGRNDRRACARLGLEGKSIPFSPGRTSIAPALAPPKRASTPSPRLAPPLPRPREPTMHPLLHRLRAHLPTARRSTITTLQLLTAFHLLTTDVAEVRLCSGFSMLPTLSHEGDFVLISPIPLRAAYDTRLARAARGETTDTESSGIHRGDIVIATSPTDPSKTVCKRVIGLEGDVVEVDPTRRSPRRRSNRKDPAPTWEQLDATHRETLRRHHAGDDPAALVPVFPSAPRAKTHVHIPRGHVWLAGDNLSNSTDSRAYGPVPVALLKGKVLARVSFPPPL